MCIIDMIWWDVTMCAYLYRAGFEGRDETECWIGYQVWNQHSWRETGGPWWSSIREGILLWQLKETWYRLHRSLLPTSCWYSCAYWSHGLILSLCFCFHFSSPFHYACLLIFSMYLFYVFSHFKSLPQICITLCD